MLPLPKYTSSYFTALLQPPRPAQCDRRLHAASFCSCSCRTPSGSTSRRRPSMAGRGRHRVCPDDVAITMMMLAVVLPQRTQNCSRTARRTQRIMKTTFGFLFGSCLDEIRLNTAQLFDLRPPSYTSFFCYRRKKLILEKSGLSLGYRWLQLQYCARRGSIFLFVQKIRHETPGIILRLLRRRL